MEQLKNDMDNLIHRWFMLNENEIDYEELVQCEKERVEKRMGDLIEGAEELLGLDVSKELEDMIPEPICRR